MSRLEPGQAAPPIKTVAMNGENVVLEEMQGKKVWLCFYRYFGCPLCIHHVFEVASRQDLLEAKNLSMVAIFESERLKFGKLHGKTFPNFPLISDPGQELYDEYGVERNMAGVVHPVVAVKFMQVMLAGFRQGKVDGPIDRMPAHFLVREDGTIHTAYYSKHAADHIPWEMVNAFLAEPPVPVKKKKKDAKTADEEN
jgi:peroxiredoxin